MSEYTEEVKKLLKKSEIISKNLCHKYVGTEHFLLAVLKSNNALCKNLNNYDVTYEEYENKLLEVTNKLNSKPTCIIYTPVFKRIIDNASVLNKNESENIINENNILLSMIEEKDCLGVKILEYLDVDIDNLYLSIKKESLSSSNLYLKEIGINLNVKAKNNELDKTIGRDKELNRVIEILARKNKNNPILIGEAGVGKTAIVEELARRISLSQVPEILKNKEIVSISMSTLVSGTKYRGEFEEKLQKVIKELENNNNLILFIDEIHTVVGAGGAEGAIDASNILKPYLARSSIKCIGATTINEYKKFIEKDKALERRFQKVYVNETNKEETLNILKKIRKDYENFHNVKVPKNILDLIVELTDKYIHNRKEPDRSIDVLDEVCAKANVEYKNEELNNLINEKRKVIKLKNQYIKGKEYDKAGNLKKQENLLDKKITYIKNKKVRNEVSLENLKEVLELKSNSIITELNNNDLLINKLKNNLNCKIIGQEKVIDEISEIIQTKNLSYKTIKPLSIVFEGPTGVGKTECAKVLADNLKYNLIKLDMSEFNQEMSVNKIIGASQGYVGYDEVNTVFESVKDNPNSLIILDEFDKANKKVIDLFFQILDEGTLKTSKGDKIDFKNCLFILTTNHFRKSENIGFVNKKSEIDVENYSSEFINRIDYFLTFKTLTEENIIDIIKKTMNELEIEDIEIDYEKIINNSKYKAYGARRIRNLLIKEISNKLVKN